MKQVSAVLDEVERRLARTWAQAVVAEGAPAPDSAGWPHEFPLGRASSTALASSFPQVVAWAAQWRRYGAEHDVEVRHAVRRVLGTDQQLPTHVVVPDVDTAAKLVAGPWPARLRQGRARAAVLAAQFPHLLTAPASMLAEPALAQGDATSSADPAQDAVDAVDAGGTNEQAGQVLYPALVRAVRAVDAFSDLDFELLCRAAAWFAAQVPVTGLAGGAGGGLDGVVQTRLTPRQVPIEGLHAKWLNTRQHLVRLLAGRDDLGLAPAHPPRVNLTYLDPGHLAGGGRRHDCVSVGDVMAPAYTPRIVLISENKDTAVNFPPVPGGVSVEGVGRGGSTIAAVPWLVQAPVVVYWGDMDVDGLEILDGFRAAGVPAASMLMDVDAYRRWGRWGTNQDPKGRPVRWDARNVPHLTSAEAELYTMLTAPVCAGFRRVEQERIPLSVAAEHLAAIVVASGLPS